MCLKGGTESGPIPVLPFYEGTGGSPIFLKWKYPGEHISHTIDELYQSICVSGTFEDWDFKSLKGLEKETQGYSP